MSEKDYDELRRLGTVLHIPTPEQFWAFSVKDQYDNVTHEHKERGHSWVRNAYNLLVSQMCAVNAADTTFGAGKINMVNTDGSVRCGAAALGQYYYQSLESQGSGYVGTSGSNANGIVIGTGSTAWTFDDIQLAAIIANGTAAGQLSYQAGTLTKVYSIDTKTYEVTHTRIFNNNSGSPVTINEVGIYGYIYNNNVGAIYVAMVTRDVLATPVVVAAASTLTATYTIAVAYPA